MPDSTEIVVVYVTSPQEEAARIARSLVERRLAACVNIVSSVRSVYRWKDAVHDEPESLLVIKTTRDRLDALTKGVIEVHPYELPEVIAIPVVAGHTAYLSWVAEGVSE